MFERTLGSMLSTMLYMTSSGQATPQLSTISTAAVLLIYMPIRHMMPQLVVGFLSAADCANSQSNAFGFFDAEWSAVPVP
jgi:hypothetical protein